MTIRQNNHVHVNIIIMFTHETYIFTENTLKAESVHMNFLCSQMKNMTIRQNNHVHVNIIIMFTHEIYTVEYVLYAHGRCTLEPTEEGDGPILRSLHVVYAHYAVP